HRADLSLPQLTRFRIDRQAVPVAMAVGEDFGLGSGAPGKRIVCGRAAVVPEAQGFSHVIIQALGFHPQTVVVSAIATYALAVADGYIKRSVRSEVDSPCQIAAALPCVRDENLLNIGELGAAQASTCDAQREPLLTALRIREVHQLIL